MEYMKINLQLFANANTQTTTLSATGNDLSVEMKTYYDTELIEMAAAQLIHNQFGKKKPIPAGRGKTVEWRKWSNFSKALTALVEGVTPDGNMLNVSNITKEVAQYGDYTTISDVLELTAIDDVVLEATGKHGENAGLTIDTITRNEIQTGSQVIYAPTWSGGTATAVTLRHKLDATAVISSTLVAKAATQLKKNNAPKIDGSYVAIIHPSVAFDLRQDSGWLDAHKYSAAKEIFNGEIGELHGVRFVESTEAKIFCGADLASDNRTLLTNGAITTAASTVTFDGGTVAANALKGRYIIIGTTKYYVISNTTTVITIGDAVTKEATTIESITDGTTIYPGEGGAAGVAVYGCLFLGKEAYGVVDVSGGGMEMIIKQKGSAGSADPLDQRSTVGWKAISAAKILIPEYILRLECGSSFSATDEAN